MAAPSHARIDASSFGILGQPLRGLTLSQSGIRVIAELLEQQAGVAEGLEPLPLCHGEITFRL